MSERQLWNVVVAGGGAAGCATALGLAMRGIDGICVVDPGAGTNPRLGETIPPDARIVLNDLGVWADFLAQQHERCLGSCSVWGGPEPGYNDFLLSPYGGGWHLDRVTFEAMLCDRAAAAGAVLLRDTKVETMTANRGRSLTVEVSGPGGRMRRLEAGYVVDATGWRSGIARQAGARWQVLDRLTFVYGFFDTSGAEAASKLTLLEAEELGWWYAVSLPGRKLAVAFASDPDIVRDLRLGGAPNWLERLRRTEHVSARTEKLPLQSVKLAVRVAPSTRLDRANAARWLAVGDAAAACDPISSQGIVNALEDGLHASEAIANAAMSGQAINSTYSDGVTRRFADYIENRNHFYRAERRWRESPFWLRRQNAIL